MFARLTFAALAAAAPLLAQDTTPLMEPAQPPAPVIFPYEGKPITLPFHCTLDDMRWAGMSCSEEEPCPVYLELSSAEGVGEKLFAAGNIHSEAVTLYSVLLSSADGGHSWQIAPETMRGAGLDRIQFLDGLTGWVAGQTLYPISQDPFFLLTTDGGKSWRMKPIFNESRYASIQQFAFESKTVGDVIVDNGASGDTERYSRLESLDGGETWTIKEENKKPLQIKRLASPVASTWRVRADAATRAYRIEHRVGNQWTVVAAFTVKLPACM